MSTSESLIADTENSIVNADSLIVVTENRIVVAESSVADAESEQEKLESKFGTKLDEDYDQREKSSAKSFKLYLDMTIHVLNQSSLTLRDLILLIEKRNYSKTKATLATSSLPTSSLKKTSFSQTSDFIFTMGNKILDFLRDAQMQRADQNLDYIGLLKSIQNEEDKERLKNSIEVLSQSDLLQDLNFPERIADEWLYLSAKRHKQGLLKIHGAVVDTIKTKAADPEIIDLTSEHFPAGVTVTDPQIITIKKLFSGYKTQMRNFPSNSVSKKRPRTAIVVRSSKRLADNSSSLNKPHCVVTKMKTSSVRKPGRKNQQGRPRKNQTVQIQAVEDNEDQDDVDDQDNEDAHPEDVQQVDGEPDDNDDRKEQQVDEDIVVDTLHSPVICSDDEDVHQPEGGEQDYDNDANIGDIEANIDEKEKQQDVDTPKCPYPDYSDDDEEINDKEDSTLASNRNVHEDVTTRKRKRQSSVFSIRKNRLREDFEDVLSSFECPLSSNEIIEIGKDLFLALRKKYLEIPGSDVEKFAMLLQASFEPVTSSVAPVVTNISNSSSTPQSKQGQTSESATSSVKASQPVTSSVAPAATNISNSSSTPQSQQGQPSQSATSSATNMARSSSDPQSQQGQPSQSATSSATNMASDPQSQQRRSFESTKSKSSSAAQAKQRQTSESTKSKSSSAPQAKQRQTSESTKSKDLQSKQVPTAARGHLLSEYTVTSSSTPQSKQAKSATILVNASKPVSSSAVSSVAKGFAKLARSAQSNDASTLVQTAPRENPQVSSSVISREGSQSVVPQTQPESYMGSAKPLTNRLTAQETEWAKTLREVFYKVKLAGSDGFNVNATVMLQAILFFALPSQHVHPEIGNVKLFLSNIKETDLQSGNWLTVTSENADMLLELDGEISIESLVQQSNRTSNNKVNSSLIPSQIEVLLSKSSEFIEENANVFGLSKRILFSIAVKQPIISDIESIPMSFPVTLSGRRVVLQTFAGYYDSSSPDESTPYIRVYTRDTIVNHHGQYFLCDSDGSRDYGTLYQNRRDLDFRKPLPLLSGRAAGAASRNLPLKKLFFIESMSQNEFDPQRTLSNEVVLVAGSGAIKADELEQFEQEVCVDSAIINAFKDVLLSFQPTHPCRKKNIILPVDFYSAVLKKKDETDEEHKSHVKVYLDQYIRPLALTSDSILHIPVNYECIHYFYCAVVFSKGTIYICDSVSEKAAVIEIDHLPVYLTLCEVLNWELEYRNMETIHWNGPVLCSDVMQQQEHPLTRCGVYCMVFLLRGFLEGIYCDSPFETYELSKATFSNPFFKLLKKRILCVLSREISLYQLLELFVESKDLSSERRIAKDELLTNYGVLGKKKSYDFVCKKGWLPLALYPSFLNN